MKTAGTILAAITLLASIVNAAPSISPFSFGEVAWYRLDQPVSDNFILDSSENGYDGTITGAIASHFTGESYLFANEGVEMKSPVGMPGGIKESFTWSVQFKTTAPKFALIARGETATQWLNGNSNLALEQGPARFVVKPMYPCISPGPRLDDGQWHTLTVTLDSSNGYTATARLYIDGYLNQGQWFQDVNLQPENPDTFSFFFGNGAYGRFVGEMRDIRIYDKILTEKQIAVIAGRPNVDPHLVLRYEMNDPVSHGGFTDTSGEGRNGGMAWDTPDSPRISHFTGSSFAFENDTVRTWASKTYSFSTSTPFTWAVWVKTTTGGTLFNRGSESAPWAWNTEGYKQFSLTTTPQFPVAGIPFFSAYGEYPATGTISVADGKWHHVAATFDGEGTVRLYIDGQFNVAQGMPLQTVADPQDYMFFFGLGAGIRYIGEMADLRIYDRELSAEELSRMAWVGDFDGDRDVDMDDWNVLAEEWLNDYTATPFDANDVENGDFESYSASTPVETNWEEFYYAGYLGSTSSSEIALITDPANAHSGSQALTWHYDSADTSGNNANFTEILYYFDTPIKNLSDYDQMRVWIKRHSGNSQENLLYVKFFDYGYDIGNIAAEAWLVKSEGSTYANPDEWYEWIIDLEGMMFKTGNGYMNTGDILDLSAILFGVSDDEGTGGTGTIDIDDIVLVKLATCSEQKAQDLNNDCVIDLADVAIFIEGWLSK